MLNQLLDIHVCVGSVWTQPPYNNTNPPTPNFLSTLNQVSFTRPAVCILTAVWHHISEGRGHGVDWKK